MMIEIKKSHQKRITFTHQTKQETVVSHEVYYYFSYFIQSECAPMIISFEMRKMEDTSIWKLRHVCKLLARNKGEQKNYN